MDKAWQSTTKHDKAHELWGMRTSVITVRHCWKGYNPFRHLVWITLYLFWGWETHWIESNRCCWVISISFARRWRSRMRCWRLAWTSARRGKPPYWSQNNTNGWGSIQTKKSGGFLVHFPGDLWNISWKRWVNLGKPRSLGHDFWRVLYIKRLSWQATYAVALGALGERQTFEVGIPRPWFYLQPLTSINYSTIEYSKWILISTNKI